MRMGLFRSVFALISVVLFLLPSAAKAGGCIESIDERIEFHEGKVVSFLDPVVKYIAVLGERDLSNSSGARLTDFRAVLQQDRANLHKTGKADSIESTEDGREQYFNSLERRRLLSTTQYYNYCSMSAESIAISRQHIVSGMAPFVWVIVFRHPNGELAIFADLVG